MQCLRWTTRLNFTEKRSIFHLDKNLSRAISIQSRSPSDSRSPLLPRHSQYPPPSHKSLGVSAARSSCFLKSKRFISTKVDVTQNLGPSIPDAAPPSASLSDFTSSSLDGITTDISPQFVGEHLGYLKELGLNYGWGPTAIMETVLESIHITTGTPWWGSLLLMSLLVRVVFLQPMIRASDTSARLYTLQPLVAPIKQRMDAARVTRDTDALKLAALDMKKLYKVAEVNPWRVWLPFLATGPIVYGVFRLLRGMANLPVPGLDEGGVLWFSDLTVYDPYFILPLVTGLCLHWTFKKGGEVGASKTVTPAMRGILLYGLPIMSTAFMSVIPAAVQLSFGATSVLTLIQTHYLRQPWVREFLGIQPLPKPETSTSESPYKGTITIQAESTRVPEQAPSPAPKSIVGGAVSDIKGAASQFMKTARSWQNSEDTKQGNQRLTQAELKRAHAYEARRQREIAQEKSDARTAPSRRTNRYS